MCQIQDSSNIQPTLEDRLAKDLYLLVFTIAVSTNLLQSKLKYLGYHLHQCGLASVNCCSTMDAAHTIREAVARVTANRLAVLSDPLTQAATQAVKSFQAKRFSGTYGDLLASVEFGAAARFFLEDLYSDKDYSQRDAQFSRIAGALQTLFPQQVVATAVSLAQLHQLTEELDAQMAAAWITQPPNRQGDSVTRYMASWKQVGRELDRKRQLDMVLSVGADLDRLTRTPGLRFMLRMMRRPASAAGLGSLQNFLETGFDTFSGMSGNGSRAREFLQTIQNRESAWIERLSRGEAAQCHIALDSCLASAMPDCKHPVPTTIAL